jgi:hypothetical protein
LILLARSNEILCEAHQDTKLDAAVIYLWAIHPVSADSIHHRGSCLAATVRFVAARDCEQLDEDAKLIGERRSGSRPLKGRHPPRHGHCSSRSSSCGCSRAAAACALA